MLLVPVACLAGTCKTERLAGRGRQRGEQLVPAALWAERFQLCM